MNIIHVNDKEFKKIMGPIQSYLNEEGLSFRAKQKSQDLDINLLSLNSQIKEGLIFADSHTIIYKVSNKYIPANHNGSIYPYYIPTLYVTFEIDSKEWYYSYTYEDSYVPYSNLYDESFKCNANTILHKAGIPVNSYRVCNGDSLKGTNYKNIDVLTNNISKIVNTLLTGTGNDDLNFHGLAHENLRKSDCRNYESYIRIYSQYCSKFNTVEEFLNSEGKDKVI